jgi:hypothetical protein
MPNISVWGRQPPCGKTCVYSCRIRWHSPGHICNGHKNLQGSMPGKDLDLGHPVSKRCHEPYIIYHRVFVAPCSYGYKPNTYRVISLSSSNHGACKVVSLHNHLVRSLGQALKQLGLTSLCYGGLYRQYPVHTWPSYAA